MRVVVDVSPLSHPRTGVGNYVRGSLAGLVEAAGSEHGVVAFAPTSPQGQHAIPRALPVTVWPLPHLHLAAVHEWLAQRLKTGPIDMPDRPLRACLAAREQETEQA